jgi:hypothetical protein
MDIDEYGFDVIHFVAKISINCAFVIITVNGDYVDQCGQPLF